jgi:hypothetical protein
MKELAISVFLTLILALVVTPAGYADDGPWRQNHFEIGVRWISTTNLGLQEKISPEIYLSKQIATGIKSVVVIVSLSERETPKIGTRGGRRDAVSVEMKLFLVNSFSFNLGAQLSQTRTSDWTKNASTLFTRVGYVFNNGLSLVELRVTAPDNTDYGAQSTGIRFSSAIPTKGKFTYIWDVGHSVVSYNLSSDGRGQHGTSLQFGVGVRF